MSGLTYTHEFKIGHYEIRPNDDNMTLFVRLDRYDLLQVVQSQVSCIDSDMFDVCITEYLSNHLKLSFDGQEACFNYQSHEIKEEFIEIYFQIALSPNGVQEIKVFNDALLEQWEKQENIVYSMLNGKRRSFRLNRNRINTVISYND